MSELIQFDGRTVAVIAPEDLEALEADNERLLGLLRGCVKAMERDVDTRRCATSTLRALNEARAALAGAGDQPNSTCERGEARNPVCPLPESGCDDSGSAAGPMPQPPTARECLAIINCSVHGRQIDYFLCPKCAADQPAAAPQAPIARVTVRADGGGIVCALYAPGLPPGEYDLYCEPEATAPMLRAADNSAAQPDSVPTITPHDDPCLLVAGMSEDFIGGSISDQPDAAREIERANLVYERGAFVLMELMKAYERRVRSDCKSQADLDAKPWECAEYRAAADFLRKTWPTPAAADQPAAATGPVWKWGDSVGINDHIEFCTECHYSRWWVAKNGHGKDCPHRTVDNSPGKPQTGD